jgi:hypothetical protein
MTEKKRGVPKSVLKINYTLAVQKKIKNEKLPLCKNVAPSIPGSAAEKQVQSDIKVPAVECSKLAAVTSHAKSTAAYVTVEAGCEGSWALTNTLPISQYSSLPNSRYMMCKHFPPHECQSRWPDAAEFSLEISDDF